MSRWRHETCVSGFENQRRRYGSAEAAPAPTRLPLWTFGNPDRPNQIETKSTCRPNRSCRGRRGEGGAGGRPPGTHIFCADSRRRTPPISWPHPDAAARPRVSVVSGGRPPVSPVETTLELSERRRGPFRKRDVEGEEDGRDGLVVAGEGDQLDEAGNAHLLLDLILKALGDGLAREDVLDHARGPHVARRQGGQIPARADQLDHVVRQSFLLGYGRVHDPLERLGDMARGDEDGELPEVPRQRGVEAQVLSEIAHALGEGGVMHQRDVGAADLPALRRDTLVHLLPGGVQGAEDVREAGHRSASLEDGLALLDEGARRLLVV